MNTLNSHDYVRLAAEAIVAPRTVARLYAGRKTSTTTRERVRAAAERLGFPQPPEERELATHGA